MQRRVPKRKHVSPLTSSKSAATPTLGVSAPTSVSAADLRSQIQELVEADLLGPVAGADEEIPSQLGRPRDRYLVGALAPHGSSVVSEERDVLASAGTDSAEEGPVEGESAATDHLFPSSIGLSFVVAADASALKIVTSWGRYEKTESAHETTPTGKPRRVWKRQAKGGKVKLALAEAPVGETPDPSQVEVRLEGRIRKSSRGWVVTLFLINRHSPSESDSDAVWIFQPEIIVEDDGGAAVFLQRSEIDATGFSDVEREERERLKMLYRDELEYSVGHSVAVHAEVSDQQRARAVRLKTRVLPWFDVPQVEAPRIEENSDLRGVVLDMKLLRELSPPEVLASLRVLVEAYGRWIAARQLDVANGERGLNEQRAAADKALSACSHTLTRLRAGVDLLATHAHAMEAFQFANRAMWLQRIKSLVARRVRKSGSVPPDEQAAIDEPRNRTWRPFQLAFILLESAGHHRSSPFGSKSSHGSHRGPALVPDRGRQDRSLSRTDGLHAGLAEAARAGRWPQWRARAGRHHALHAAPADDSTIPARNSIALCLRIDPAK